MEVGYLATRANGPFGDKELALLGQFRPIRYDSARHESLREVLSLTK